MRTAVAAPAQEPDDREHLLTLMARLFNQILEVLNMKSTPVSPRANRRHAAVATEGDRSTRNAGSWGLRNTDGGGTIVYPVRVQNFIGANVVEVDHAEVNILIGGAGVTLDNDDGQTLPYGTVVVASAGGLVTTTTAQDTRTVGIVQRSTDDTLPTPTIFVGYVGQVNTTGTVNADDYLETSTSAGLARSSGTTRRIGTFGRALTAGPNPSAIIWMPDAVTSSSSGGGSGVGAHVSNTVAQTVSTSTLTPLLMDSEIFDTDGFHSTVSNTSRMTVPTGFAGRYIVIGHSYHQGAIGADASIQIFRNGSPIEGSIVYFPKADSGTTTVTVCQVASGDYIELVGYNNSGGNRDFGYPADGLRNTLSLIAP